MSPERSVPVWYFSRISGSSSLSINLKKLSTIKKNNNQIFEKLTENVTHKELQVSLSKFEGAFINSLILMENNITSVVELETQKHENKDEKSQPQGIGLAFFISGVVLHLVLEFIGFNKFYCNSRCRATLDILQ